MAVNHRNELAEWLERGGPFDCAFQSLNEAIVIYDHSLKIVYVNDHFLEETGYTRQELLGRTMGSLISGEENQELVRSKGIEALHGAGDKFQTLALRKDGAEIWADVRTSALRGPGGNVLGAVAACSNVTKNVIAKAGLEQEVRAQAGELENIVKQLEKEVEERQLAEKVALSQRKLLCDMLDALAANPDLDLFMETLLKAINETLDAASSGIWFRLDKSGYSQPYATYPRGPLDLRENLRLDAPAHENLYVKMVPFVVDVPARRETLPKEIRELYDRLGVKATLTVPMCRAKEAIGFVSIRRHERHVFTDSEIEVAIGLADIAALAVELKRLAERSRGAAILEERNRFAREIHDTLAQEFTGVMLHSSAAKQSMMQGYPGAAAEHLDQVRNLAREGLAEARRSVFALRAAALDNSDLSTALTALAKRLRVPGIKTKCKVSGTPFPIRPEIESNLLRIAQEAVSNSARHSGASRITLSLTYEKPCLTLVISDNGSGFDLEDARQKGFGLETMHERAESVGMDIDIESKPTGTTIKVFAQNALLKE